MMPRWWWGLAVALCLMCVLYTGWAVSSLITFWPDRAWVFAVLILNGCFNLAWMLHTMRAAYKGLC